ncbi:unnamed protein product [Rhizoctonia solani]|uniref:Uncharacterized protein n=1 Tax=Rhizoctonia solani TaxID=456999 RepID=A0A8H3HLC4_9AGAM|nr:unnamed protein product [Rhizoctonia solani]
MPPKILGGYILTYQEAADAAHKLGLSWNSDPKVNLGCRQEINNWMKKNAPGLWPYRLQPITIEEAGKTITKLIFPIVGNSEPQPAEFEYSTTEGTAPARFRDIGRRLNMPDEFFANFITIHKPELTFLAPPGSRLRLHRR